MGAHCSTKSTPLTDDLIHQNSIEIEIKVIILCYFQIFLILLSLIHGGL